LQGHFVLDENFPWFVAGFKWPPSVRVSRLRDVDPTLLGPSDDWQILLALHRRGDVDGFITNDAKMLLLPTEMVALMRTRLRLVITDGVGHEPIRATGLVMTYLEMIARQAADDRPHIFVLRPGPLRPVSPGAQIDKIALRESLPPNQVISRECANMGLPTQSPS
jgi:hypothetical protein